jgi:YD repeat-containing protein
MSNLILLIIFSLTSVSFAGVNLKNGNFYIGYTDIVVPGGGHDLEITRTYNSYTTTKGWFGLGWGSPFETKLSTSSDGSVVIIENGSGAKTRFTPKKKIDPNAAAQKIVDAMRKQNDISGVAEKNMLKRLASDATLRQSWEAKLGLKTKLASGSVLYSNTRGLQELHKMESGYKRVQNDGKLQFFNNEGLLVKIKDKHGYTVSLDYQKGVLKSVKDSQAKQLFFDWYDTGLVKSIWSSGEKKAGYKYDSGGNLSYAKDVEGNSFQYEYNKSPSINKITYSDNSIMEISYVPKTYWVSSIADRNGTKTNYKYEFNPNNKDNHYWTTVSKKGFDGKMVNNRYEYEIKKRPDGSSYTYRILTNVNGLETETVYSECCSLPLKIKRGKQVTTFDYNDKGLLVKKASTRGDYVELKYHKKHNKITRVVNNKGWTNFEYDKKGNLSKAVDNKGKSVLLIYDRSGRIKKMVDYSKKSKRKRTLAFKYNALGKPVEIVMEKVGKINVAYDNYGEIKKVESKSGHKMALQVTQAFQSLLSIVKPAGVNLNM